MNRYRSIYKNTRIKIIYPSFKIDKYNNFSNKVLSKKNNNFVLLGRISPDKRTFDAINFFINFKQKYKNLNIGKLLVIGPSNKNDKIKLNFIKKEYSQSIKILGYLKWKKQNEILKKNKFGIHFCKYEHFGRAILEMQKKELIVFAHKSGGCLEIVNQKFCSFSKIKDLEKKILYVIKNKNIQKKIYKWNKKVFNKNFTTKKFDKEIINFIK